jgi:Tfp pilus assembly protein PilW
MKKNFSTKISGYSLLEIIVYLGIFTVISILVINSFIIVASSFRQIRTNRDLLESGSTAMERISREIREAGSIDIPNSTLGTSPGALQLNSTDSGGEAQLVNFNVLSGAINLTEGGVLTGNLLGSNVIVTSLIFRRMSTSASEAVKIEMTLQDTRSKHATTKNFYDTVILRNEY